MHLKGPDGFKRWFSSQELAMHPVRLFSGGRNGFPFSLTLSLFAHSLLIATLIFLAGPTTISPVRMARAEARTISALAAELALKSAPPGEKTEEITFEKVEDLLTRIYRRLEFSRDLTDKERSEIFRDLIDPGNQAAAADISAPISEDELDKLIDRRIKNQNFELSSGDTAEVFPGGGSEKFAVRKISQAQAAEIDRLQSVEASAAVRTILEGKTVLVPVKYGTAEVPAEYYFRASPLRRIAALGADIFTIIREGGAPPVFLRGQSSEDARPDAEAIPLRLSGDSTGLLVFIHSGQAPPIGERRGRLSLSPPELERVLDGLMPLGEEEQLTVFKTNYLDRYDWEEGDLALLTREFLFNNLNGVFFVLDDLAAAFDQTEELFFKRPVYDLFTRLGGLAPGSRTDAEIQFYLVSALDFELRTIERMLAAMRELDEVAGEQRTPATLFQPEAKALVLKHICDDFLRRAGKLGMSPEEVIDWHLAHQTLVLERLTEAGGEVRNRALYALGKLLWWQGEYESAVMKWRQVGVSAPMHSRTFWSIMHTVDRYGLTKGSRKAVDEKLDEENASERDKRLARHLRFHTWARRSEKSGDSPEET